MATLAGVAAWVLVLSACGSSEPPSISNLEYTETTIQVGDTDSLTGTFEFEAPDGNMEKLGIEIELPDGQRGELPRSDLAGVDGVESGVIEWGLFLQPQLEGEHRFEIFVIDTDGNQSNKLSGSFEAVAGTGTAAPRWIDPVIIEARAAGPVSH